MRKVSEIMAHNPAICMPDTKLEEVAKLMVECDCGQIPVVNNQDEKKPVGVITDRDITCRTVAVGKNPLELSAQDCMTNSVCTVAINASLDDCLSLMNEKKIRRIPVVDDKGRCCGMISQADVVKNLDKSQAGEFVSNISESSDSASQMHH